MTRSLYWLRVAVEFFACALVSFIPFYLFVEVTK